MEIIYTDENEEASKLTVDFYKDMHDEYDLTGEIIKREEKDFIRITSPGDPLNVIVELVNDGHKKRFSKRWQSYSGVNAQTGTPIKDWPEIPEPQRDLLLQNGFRTIEQVAGSSDAAFSRIMGGIQWRLRAQEWVNSKKITESGTVKRQAEQIATMQAQIEQLLAKDNKKEKIGA